MGLLYLFIAVLLHELGHYTVCRWYGITPKTVCVFFNPHFSLVKFSAWGTQWRIGWLPFGGYTDIPGWQFLRTATQLHIAIAGIVVNHLAAVVGFVYNLPGQFIAINWVLAAISLLPFTPYDGSYIFKKKAQPRPDNWVIKEVQCSNCSHTWKGLCLEDTAKLQCPSCHELSTFKTFKSDPLKNYKNNTHEN